MNAVSRIPARTLSELTRQRQPWVDHVRELAFGYADAVEKGYPVREALRELVTMAHAYACKVWEPSQAFVWTGYRHDAAEMLKNELRRRREYQRETKKLMAQAAESVLVRGGAMHMAARAVAAVAAKRDPVPKAAEMEDALQQGAWRAKRVPRVAG